MSPSKLEDRFQTLHEIVRAARLSLAPGPWDYLAGGTETETTLRRNRQALDSIAFRPRVLRNVSKIDSTSTLFGRTVRIPVMIAPVGSVETFEPGGGATAAKASAEFNVPQMLSSVCNPGLEAVAAAADNFRIFQLYVLHDIPLILKGIATAEDAALACDHGVDGVYVSNHGGRQLDHGRGSADVLPEVVAAVRGRSTIIVDGSFMRGTDVVKAIALGAQAVGIGRLCCCGLAAAGQAGLVRVFELLEEEIRICLGLLGVDRVSALNSSYLHPASPVRPAHVASAFPLLEEEGY